ncbi:MAG: hypothetical protein U0105_23625 [Candidatus Obscuribacterales bacterium]
MAEPERNVDSNHRPISQPTEIEKALRRNLYELQRLAVFYHKRGNVEQARELYQMMINIEERLQNDYEPRRDRTAHWLRSTRSATRLAKLLN